MCTIAWCSLSWDAFATLFTGVLAVSGAILIGWRQTEISNRQNEILQNQNVILEKQTRIAESQVQLERLKLRSDLYQVRSEVVAVTKEWFAIFTRDGSVATGPEARPFIEAIGKAEFLFRPQVAADMRAWYELGMRHLIFTNSQRDNEALQVGLQLIAASNRIAEVFGPEMRLGEEIEQPQPAPPVNQAPPENGPADDTDG